MKFTVRTKPPRTETIVSRSVTVRVYWTTRAILRASGCQHLPQNLGDTEDYQQTKCIFISSISTSFRIESLKDIENLIKIECRKLRGQPLNIVT